MIDQKEENTSDLDLSKGLAAQLMDPMIYFVLKGQVFKIQQVKIEDKKTEMPDLKRSQSSLFN